MLWTILLILLLALAAPGLTRLAPRASAWVLGAGSIAVAAYYGGRFEAILGGAAVVERLPWVAGLGVDLAFRLDGLSMMFAILVCGVGGLILIYAGGYLAGHPHLGRLLAFLLMFQASMLGLVLADNLLLLFVFWELTSISSFFLIGFDHSSEDARQSALQALLVTGLGGLCLLAGFLLLGQAGGSLDVGGLLAAVHEVHVHPSYPPALLLILLGAFTKSAQVPFHFWLPAAMVAPTPVSAYLHSVTMVKAGIYLLLRLSPILGGTALWHGSMEVVGGVTMLLGAWLAVQQRDLKKILAYSTISSLGTLVFLIGLDSPRSLEAALVYLFAHALYKGALFLTVGIVDHSVGTRDVERLGGLVRHAPWLAAVAGIAALSMAGAPPMLGFLGKELLYEVVLTAPRAAILSGLTALATSVLLVAAACLVAVRPFWGRLRGGEELSFHAVPVSLFLAPTVLAALGLIAALWSASLEAWLLAPAASALLEQSRTLDLKLWHGWTWVLAFSALTLLAGGGLYPLCAKFRRLPARWPLLGAWGPSRWYVWALAGLKGFSQWQTRVLQNGRLRVYLLTVVTFTVVLVGGVLAGRSDMPIRPQLQPWFLRDLVLICGVLAAAWICLSTGSRLTAIVAMGVVGYGVALIYVQFGAPDLAMTQFLIETMTVVLFALTVHRLPLFSRLRGKTSWQLDAVVALAAGGLMAVLSLVAMANRHGGRLANYFLEQSVPAGHGRNVVNVILVDFRALDTLGEITVLAVAGAGVLALLKLSVGRGDKS